MSRKPRKHGVSGIYHILLRCEKNGTFFREESDFKKFREIIEENCRECGYTLYAYVLRLTEVQLLIKVGKIELERIFKKLCVKYTYWYNCKYRRSGSLFFDRFMSEPVDDNESFENILRYIIRRPEDSGDCSDYTLYKYSRFYEDNIAAVIDALDEDFFDYPPVGEYLKVNERKVCITDEEAIAVIKSVMKMSPEEVSQLPPKERYASVDRLIKRGVGYRQLARLCRMNFATIKKSLLTGGEPIRRKKVKDEAKKTQSKPKKTAEKKNDNQNKEEKKTVVDLFSM